MINAGLADNIIETFGFRKPTRPEKHEFQTALKKGEPPIPEATRAQEMATLANLIKAKLGPRFQTIHNSKPRVPPPSHRDPIKKLSQDLVKFKNYLSEAVETLKKINPELKNDLDKVGKGVRTSLAIIALLLKTIISRLDQAGQFTKVNFDKFFEAGLTFTQEIASLPQALLFSTINYLSGRSLTDDLSCNNYIAIPSLKFTESRFETDIATGELGTTDNFITALKIEHDKLTQQYEQLQKNFEEEKKKATFGCPAKFVRVNLEIDGKEKSVDFIEAIYRITHKIVSRSLFGEQESVASKSDTEKVFAA